MFIESVAFQAVELIGYLLGLGWYGGTDPCDFLPMFSIRDLNQLCLATFEIREPPSLLENSKHHSHSLEYCCFHFTSSAQWGLRTNFHSVCEALSFLTYVSIWLIWSSLLNHSVVAKKPYALEFNGISPYTHSDFEWLLIRCISSCCHCSKLLPASRFRLRKGLRAWDPLRMFMISRCMARVSCYCNWL